ncbi:MAG TPA: hypothetical protein ENK72_01890 [Epsilonproteobacteria bacterium]|nr:hypothetical protein [Campylobacterota bacterium]
MKRSSALEHLEAARRSHVKWVNRAVSIIKGKNVVRDPHPIASTHCQFGLWFNKEGETLYQILEVEGFERIHQLHHALHEKYLNIYEIYFGSAKGVVYDSSAKLEKRTVSREMEENAQQEFEFLRGLSRKMLEELAVLENTVKTSDKFD